MPQFSRWFNEEHAAKLVNRWAALYADIVDKEGEYDEFEPGETFVEDIMSKLDATGSEEVLIMGCGAGKEVDLFRKAGYDTVGTTIGIGNIIRAREVYGITDMVETCIESTTFDDNTFDVIVARHVLEHAVSPLLALLEMNRVLKPGGKVFIEVPGCPGFIEAISESERDPYHIVYPDNNIGATLLNKSNFEDINVHCDEDQASRLYKFTATKRHFNTTPEALKRMYRREGGENVSRT